MRALHFFHTSRAALILCYCMPTGAYAAPDTGTRIDATPKEVTSSQVEADGAARKVMNQFSRCYADSKPTKAISVLALPYLSEDQTKAVERSVGGFENCMGRTGAKLSFQAPAMVAGMAEEMVLSVYSKTDLSSITEITEEKMFASNMKPRNPAEDFAQCVVRQDPLNALSLIKTPVASKSEAAAVKKLVPILGPCLIAGQDIKLNVASVRAISAVGLYRIISNMASQQVKQ